MEKLIDNVASNLPQNGELEYLLKEKKMVRILRADLKARIAVLLMEHEELRPFIIRNENEFYLNLTSIADPKKRRQIYNLLQRYQLGESVSLNLLPPPLQPLVHTQTSPTSRILGIIIMGSVAGVISGVLAMAIGILAAAAFELATGVRTSGLAGIETTAIFFILFGALGWLFSAVFLWRRLRPTNDSAYTRK